MSRWVVPAGQGYVGGAPEEADNIVGRIVKFVPAEVVTAFTMLYTALVSLRLPADQGQWVAVALIILFLIVTIAYIFWRADADVRNAHLIVSPLAFLAWAYPISSAVLGSLFIGLAAFLLQALVVALAIVIAPKVVRPAG
jgi:hypothetical protein